MDPSTPHHSNRKFLRTLPIASHRGVTITGHRHMVVFARPADGTRSPAQERARTNDGSTKDAAVSRMLEPIGLETIGLATIGWVRKGNSFNGALA
jgi:hypothetical protein